MHNLRLRKNKNIREIIAETKLTVSSLILPYFIIEGSNKKEAISSFPGVYRFSLDNLLYDLDEAVKSGIKAILLFGVIDKREIKEEVSSLAWDRKGIVQIGIKKIKKEFPEIILITDLCLCGYTKNGHCCFFKGKKNTPLIDLEKTLKAYQKIALAQAEAGSDFIAPSGMMDEQVKAIREVLDKKEFFEVGILSYSAKYASAFYGPFRDVLDSSPQFGDRKSYQLDYRLRSQARDEVKKDIQEGADIVMVKPALSYLDIIRDIKENFNIPLCAYNVSGEYAMIKKYASSREEENALMLEVLTSIKRAGADMIITYFAKEAGKILKDEA